jgi:uncharacterized repeat protein (TIGR03803 family)
MFHVPGLSGKCALVGGVALAMLLSSAGADAKNKGGGFDNLYSFCSQDNCTDGANPVAGLVMDSSGNLYGTAPGDGAYYDGVIFKLAPDGTETTLYSFCPQANCPDGQYPAGSLILDSSGNLYGTTEGGGAQGFGAVFELAPNGSETVLYSFCSRKHCSDGASPVAGLVLDSSGNLYGTAQSGGKGNYQPGVVFRLAPNGVEKVLHNFCSQANCADGASPVAGLVMDSSGNLYGTTQYGGPQNYGAVFKVAPDGSETILYSFCSQANCVDGDTPVASLIMDSSGNLYGTTVAGGAGHCQNELGAGCGVAFKLAQDGTETVLYSFCSKVSCTDGINPMAGLIMDGAGNLYGTTSARGKCKFATDCGTVFKIAPNGSESTLYSFCSKRYCADGANPVANLIMDGSGNLYGTAENGAAYYSGTVFELKK